MSAFSRGFIFRHQHAFNSSRALFFFPSNTYTQPRFFSSSTILQAAKKARKPPIIKNALPKAKPSYKPIEASIIPVTYQSYATTLAQKSHPTLLYQAPSHTIFMICCYSGALFCFSYAGFNFWTQYLVPPESLASWVPIAFAGVCFVMAAGGAWLVLSCSGLIKTITAIPKKMEVVGRNPELLIEIELRKMFPVPFFPARKLLVKPEELALRAPVAAPVDRTLRPEELRQMRMQEEMARREQLEYEKSHIMTAPFRHASKGFFALFKAVGRSWSREGFLKLRVGGRQTYKLDVSGGWALDGGRALDRLATLKP
jgi:hypothetical protein